MGVTNDHDRERLTVSSASDPTTAFGFVRVNPGYPLDYQ
jgi:hypothetical protein